MQLPELSACQLPLVPQRRSRGSVIATDHVGGIR
jgi:hypothetical protein